GERRVQQIRREQVKGHGPERPLRTAGEGANDGPPKEEPGAEKTGVLEFMQAGERSARSNAAGTCQTRSVTAIMSQQFSGFVSVVPTRRSAGQVKNGPTPSRANFLGSPRKRGRKGAPSRISGGATDISNRCCTMCAESSRPEKASSGEAIASQTVPRP